MEIQKCWAYNGDALRCMQAAGHDGPHAHAIEWTDEECWAPETFERQAPQPAASNEAMVEHLVSIPKPSGKCVICDHKMHDGMCTGMDGEFPCDCANGVEA